MTKSIISTFKCLSVYLFRMASSLSMGGGSSSPDSEPPQHGDTTSDLPIGRYFLYRLVEDQKDVGYKKLLSSDIISDAQRILLEYLDLPQKHEELEHDSAKGNITILGRECQLLLVFGKYYKECNFRPLNTNCAVHFFNSFIKTTLKYFGDKT